MSLSSTKSGLHRSRSSSSIPLLVRTSSIPVKNSIQKSRGKSLTRATIGKVSLDRNMARSSSNLSEIPRLSRQRSGSLNRQTLNTPLNQMGSRSSRKSPLLSSVRKDIRPITDKRWQYEQIVKVRNFVAVNFTHLDHNSIKSGIPLELFVGLMSCYFQLIDRRINITRENYVEEVPTNLKRYRYPTTVKPSLMKTVNTPHSWPHVLAILSWLTDIIYQLNCPVETTSDLEGLAEKCIMGMYKLWNMNQDDQEETEKRFCEELDLQLVELLGIDDEEMNKLDNELENLCAEKIAYAEKDKDKMEEIEILQKKIKSTIEKCDLYATENETFEKTIKEHHAKYAMKMKKIDHELSALVKMEEQLKTTVASQPHSYAEKQQLTQEIKDLQSTLKLKENRHEQQLELISSYDFKLSDIKQQMEANAYQYNNVISQLELVEPEMKKFHIRESGFARGDTENEIKEALAMLQEAITKLKQESQNFNKKVEDLNQLQKQIDEEFVIVQREEEDLAKLDAEKSITLAHKIRKDELQRDKTLAEVNKLQNKLMELKSSKYNLMPLREKMKQSENSLQECKKFREDLEERALDFFLKLEARISNNLEKYMSIVENVNTKIISVQERAIENSRIRIEKLEKAREEAEHKQEK